jgi:arylsulfatase A-like enzyme
MKVLRWFQAWSAAVLWAFVLVGAIGLVEGLTHWFRFGPPEGFPDHGPLDSVIPYLTLYGWLGLASAALLFWPLALLLGRRPQAKRMIFAGSVAGALALLLTLDVGYLIKDSAINQWWTGIVAPLSVVKAFAFLVFLLVLVFPMRRLAEDLVTNPKRHLFWPVVVLVVTTSFWPDWQHEGAKARTDGLTRINESSSVTGDKNLLILSIDTLRRDHISCLSDNAPPTPALDSLAEEGLVFGNLWGTSSWTLPNMATFLTGQPPRALGLTKYTGLPQATSTLAEVAWRHGWRTAAIISNPYLGLDYGFQRGFEEFDHSIVVEPLTPAGRSVLVRELTRFWIENTMPNDASILVTKAMLWLGLADDTRPYFLWVHLLDPHLPYRWRTLPGDGGGGPPPLPDHPLLVDGKFEGLHEVRAALPEIDLDLASAMSLLYDQEVRYADDWSGRLISKLRNEGMLDNTLVVVVADHGEEFFEHGGYEHGHSLMPEVANIPLIVRLPGRRDPGTRIDAPLSSLDLMPTICREMGWAPPEGMPGQASLWPDESGQAADPTRLMVLENMLYGDDQQALLLWPYYRVENLADGTFQWFNLAEDPGAQQPLPAPPAEWKQLGADGQTLLDEWDDMATQIGAHRNGEASGLSETTRQQLRSLGY